MEVTDVMRLLSENPEGTFLQLVKFNGSQFGACRITGVAPVWEMHPDTDEFFYVLDGSLQFTLLDAEGTVCTVESGNAFVVPKGIWHKPAAPTGASFMYFTPGETIHSDKEDPRS